MPVLRLRSILYSLAQRGYAMTTLFGVMKNLFRSRKPVEIGDDLLRDIGLSRTAVLFE
jgi:hypothetical protein